MTILTQTAKSNSKLQCYSQVYMITVIHTYILMEYYQLQTEQLQR